MLEFLIPILYPEKPTRVTMTVGNTIFGAFLGEQKVDWGIILQSVIAKLVEGARKLKATPIGPYMFHLYMGQEVLSVKEMVAYDISLDLLKYDYTLELEPNQGSLARSDPQPSPSVQQNRRKSSYWPGSSYSRENRNKALDLTHQKIEEMSHSFSNAIRWMELAKIHYDQLEEVVSDVCKALGNVDIWDIDEALFQVAQKQEVADRDARISQLSREKEELQTRQIKAEKDLKLEESKTQGAHRLIGLLEEHVWNLRDVVIKARLYDEAIAKTGGVTTLELIQICVDYSTRIETILAEMRALFATQNCFFCGSSVPLEKVPNLVEFPDLPPTEVLQNLQTPTTLRTNQESMESGERHDPGSDARTKEVGRTQPEDELTPALVPTTVSETLPLPTDPALAIPSPLIPSPGLVNPEPSTSLPFPPLLEIARMYVECVRRQAALTQTPRFQELLNQSQGITQASPQQRLF